MNADIKLISELLTKQLVNLYADFHTKDFRTNGTTGERKVVLCTHDPESFFGDFEEGETFFQVAFTKFLDQVFIDFDDFDLEEFGLTDIEEAYSDIDSYQENNRKYPLTNLLKFGFNPNNDLSWYGIYVNDIKPQEVKSVTEKTL